MKPTPEQIKQMAIECGGFIGAKYSLMDKELAFTPAQLELFFTRAYDLGCKNRGESDSSEKNAMQLLTDLATALDNAFISSWQTTAGWQKQLDAALDFIRNNTGE